MGKNIKLKIMAIEYWIYDTGMLKEHMTFVDIHNYLVRTFGGGVYLAVINANDGEIVDKIDVIDAYDASDMERFL